MTKEAFERAKCIFSYIESAERNIRSFERICEAGKGEIVICTKEKLEGGHGNVPPMYFSGDTLELIKKAYINHWESFANKNQKELENL